MPKLPLLLSPVPEQENDIGGRLLGSGAPADISWCGSQGSATFSRSSGESKTLHEQSDENESEEEEEEDEREEDWDTDFETEDSKPSYDPAGKAKYLHTCQMYGVVPISYFLRHMKDSELTLMHHGLGAKGAKALALSLRNNTSIVTLNLSDNWLNGDGAAAVADMLKENCYISDVDLSENRLGVKGAKALTAMLRENTTLITLELSGNELNDDAASYLADAFLSNNKMEFLNLSHNMFAELAGHCSLFPGCLSEDEWVGSLILIPDSQLSGSGEEDQNHLEKD